jgi:quercetin dioxygenase-like cupin family protein
MSSPTTLHVNPAAAPRISIVGDICTILLGSEQTGGAFTLIHAEIAPGGGPPPHTHSREDETFVVLEGRITFTSDGRTFTAGPGETVHLPRGTRHTFTAKEPARALIHCIPAGLDRMFREAGTPLAPGDRSPAPVTPEDIERLLAITPRYGIAIHAPTP